MLNRRRSEVITLVCGLLFPLLWPSAAMGQIAAAVDEQGRTVYVNAILPEPAVRRHHRNSVFPSRVSVRTIHVASVSATPPPEPDSQSLGHLARQAAVSAAVDPDLVDAVIRVESEYNPRAVSPKGAMGLMQLIPATARRLGVADPFDPAQNLEGGTTYLRYLLDLFGGDVQLALAAYDAGENAVLRSNGIPPFAETRGYVRKVSALYGPYDRTSEASNITSAGRWPTLTPHHPIYSYVDAVGVVHFTNE
ncbi:MAG TPA: lytic transglycosylase domain-containing protein [Terriglobia bacterium]|nr:lytic transglycosylase domain-containing protein [Terriglobia bacterium]